MSDYQQPTHSEMTQRARELRRALTPAEAMLWRFLRNGHVGGLKFRRQRPIGPYVADFCCVSQRLVVELDGYSHEERERYDAGRAAWLEARGYRVLRFTNDEVQMNACGVVSAIAAACGVEWAA